MTGDIGGGWTGESESAGLSGVNTMVRDLPNCKMEGASSRASEVQFRDTEASIVILGTGWRAARAMRSGAMLRCADAVA